MKKSLIVLLLVVFSTDTFAEDMAIRLYVLRKDVDVKASLQPIIDSNSKLEAYPSGLNVLKEWRPINEVEGGYKMEPGKFHVLQISGVGAVKPLECTFDPAISGVTYASPLYVAEGTEPRKDQKMWTSNVDEWLKYDEFRNEMIGRYAGGNKVGYIFKAPEKFEGKIRKVTCKPHRKEGPSVEGYIEY